MEHPRTGTSLQQRDSSCVEPDPRKRGSAEGSEGHVKAEVEKGLHVKQQLAAWKISKAPAQGSIGFVWLKAQEKEALPPSGSKGGRGGVVLQGSPGSLRPPGFQFETWGGLWIRE